jgi:hypothetical protein
VRSRRICGAALDHDGRPIVFAQMQPPSVARSIDNRVGFRDAETRNRESPTVLLQDLSGRAHIDVAFVVVSEISARKVPSLRFDLSNTGICGSI